VPDGIEVLIYARPDGAEPYTIWENRLRDRGVRAHIRARVARIRLGNLGDAKRVGEIFELRIHTGPGYRIYFGREGLKVVVLLCGGDKATQERDIERATRYWRDYRSRGDDEES
jgi:putative addiction module killer protein